MSVSRPSSVEFTILPATENDCDALAEIEAVANGQTNKGKPESNLPRVIFGPPSKASQDFRAKDLLDKLKNDKFTRMWKAVVNDGNGKEKIAAWAHWYYYTEPQPIEWKDIEWPEPVNSDGANEYIGKAHAIRGKYMSGKKFAYLQVLATLSEYRFNGIGSALIKLGLSEAGVLGLDEFWLEASEDGHDLYEKFGFQDIEGIPVDLEKYGGVGQSKAMGMRKLPN